MSFIETVYTLNLTDFFKSILPYIVKCVKVTYEN